MNGGDDATSGVVLFSQGGVTVTTRRPPTRMLVSDGGGMVLEISRGIGPRELHERILRHRYPTLHLASPHYSAYKQNLVLVLPQQASTYIKTLSLTCVCLVQDLGGKLLKLKGEMSSLDHPAADSNQQGEKSAATLYNFPVKVIRWVSSNEMGTIAMITITNDPRLHRNACLNKVFRRVLKAHCLPVLGSAKLSVPFRGESLCMGLVNLVAHSRDGSPVCNDSLDVPTHFHGLMDREEHFATANNDSSLQLPLAYQTDTVSFDGLELFVNPNVMIPRKGSETVVALAELLYRQTQPGPPDHPIRILDLGTGSGSLLLALLRRFPHAHGVGVDFCPDALDVAKRNGTRNDVGPFPEPQRCEWHIGTFATPPIGIGRFDLIVSNPPYHIQGGRHQLNAASVEHEPHAALLVSKDDPIQHYRDIIVSALPVLANDRCVVAMEIFRDNAKDVADLWIQSGVLSQISIGKDTRYCVRSIQGLYHHAKGV
jgi:release factor glutamine methyltransferase